MAKKQFADCLFLKPSIFYDFDIESQWSYSTPTFKEVNASVNDRLPMHKHEQKRLNVKTETSVLLGLHNQLRLFKTSNHKKADDG